jgi:hypothetical protein
MNGRKKNLEYTDIIFAIALLGSLWGLFEVAVDEGVQAAGLPMRAGILTGLGMLTMGVVFGFTRKLLAILAMPFVAVVMKQLTVPILGVSVMCGVNSCLAVGLQGFAVAGLGAVFLRRRSGKNLAAGAATGAGAAVLSAVPFYFVGLRLAPCNYLMSFAGSGGFVSFLVAEGLAWAAFSTILFPLGVLLGARYQERLVGIRAHRPASFYGVLAGLTAICWVIAGIAIVVTA